jgi:hypothetical protein
MSTAQCHSPSGENVTSVDIQVILNPGILSAADIVFASSTGTPFQRRKLQHRHMVPVLEAAKLDKTL